MMKLKQKKKRNLMLKRKLKAEHVQAVATTKRSAKRKLKKILKEKLSRKVIFMVCWDSKS